MGLFTRIKKIAESEAHSLADQLEDPIKITEQGIRDLKTSLEQSLRALAEVKAVANRKRTDTENARRLSDDYERKAMLLLRKAQLGEIAEIEADRLATQSLDLKSQNEQLYLDGQQEQIRLDQQISKLDSGIVALRNHISKYENELKTLRARAQVAAATRTVNKQLAGVDSTSTVALLERMKEKIDQDEAIADAYGEMSLESRSVDDEIESALASETSSQSDSLLALKARLSANSERKMLGE
ncbi:MAG: hypothetical protein RIS47_986 [Bacteroidota bacterium]|jgi:phage shock protein A